jgi:hypothetical protein
VEQTAQAESVQEQPQEQLSVEERFANAIGIEDDPVEVEEPAAEEQETEEEAAEPEEEQEEYEILEINGEQYQVPKELKDGYLRQQDYTRKTQELASERNALTEQRQAIEQERQAFQQQVLAQQQNFQLHAKVAAIDQQIAQYGNIDWQQLMDNDPVEAMKLDRNLRDLKETRNQLVQEAIGLQGQLNQQRQAEYLQMVEKGKAELAQRIPDWNAEKAKALSSFGMEAYGFTTQEMAQVLDPRHVQVLHDAYMYRQLQAQKPDALKKVASAQNTLKKVAQQPKQSQKDVLRKVIKTSTDKQAKHDAIQRLIASRI